MANQILGRLSQSRPYVCRQCASQLSRSRRPFSASRLSRQDTKHETNGNVLELLEARGYIKEIAGDREALNKILQKKQVGVYAGIDPTAPSLHLGHLLPLMVLFWLYNHGHHTVSLVGGATARVGDPSGRLTSRERTQASIQEANFQALYKEVGRVWHNAAKYGERHGYEPKPTWKKTLLDNADWLLKLNVVSFLQMLGTGMRIGTMLGRDTVKNKMEKGDGMSFAEFTYPLLQGWDWWHMFSNNDVQLQVGGSDQYGNIVAGMDAIKHIAQTSPEALEGKGVLDASGKLKDELSPMGITVPLLTTASGEKFGKSAGNAIWLDKNLTSPFDLYGFLLRSSDADVSRYLSLFTFVPLATIKETLAAHAADPGKRLAQHLLASEVLELVHGPEVAARTRAEHQAMRNPRVSSGNLQGERTVLPRSLVSGAPFSRILWHAGITATKSEAARLLKSGGVYVATSSSSSGVADQDAEAAEALKFAQIKNQKPEDVEKDGLIVLRTGKWKVRIVEVVDDETFEKKLGEEGKEAPPGWEEAKESRGAGGS
ncbi:hypothetical protein Q7P37_006931 [Cladosporium fusiforme]